MPNKHHKRVVEFLLGPAGYSILRESKGVTVFTNQRLSHHRLGVIRLAPGINDHDATNFVHNVSRELGLETPRDPKKRKANAIKERRAKEREALQAKIDHSKAELAELVAQREEQYRHRLAIRDERNAQLDGAAAHLSDDEVTAISTRIREHEEAILEWQKLLSMPTSPTGKNWYVR